MEDDSGTETDTSSDSGHEEIDMSDLNGLNQSEASAHAFWQYRLHKRKWRRLSNKPTRKFRRIQMRFRTARAKGKGFSRHAMRTKGNGRGQPLFHVEACNETLAYFSGKGKGNRRHTSGKGTERRMNPTRRDGQVMKCRVCNSPEHFEARCPQLRSTSASLQFFSRTLEGPQTNIPNHGVTGYPIFSTNPVLVIEEPQEERTLSFMVRDRTSNDPIWQQESDPWQGTPRAVPKPPPQEHSRLAPKAKAAPEQERSPWTNRAAHAQETSAESSDTSRVAQASEQGSPVNPQQPPRLRARLRITSDLGRPLHERYEIHHRLQGTQFLRFLQIVLGCLLLISILIPTVFSTTEQKTSIMVSILFVAATQHLFELQDPVQWRSNPQLETLQPLLFSRIPH